MCLAFIKSTSKHKKRQPVSTIRFDAVPIPEKETKLPSLFTTALTSFASRRLQDGRKHPAALLSSRLRSLFCRLLLLLRLGVLQGERETSVSSLAIPCEP